MSHVTSYMCHNMSHVTLHPHPSHVTRRTSQNTDATMPLNCSRVNVTLSQLQKHFHSYCYTFTAIVTLSHLLLHFHSHCYTFTAIVILSQPLLHFHSASQPQPAPRTAASWHQPCPRSSAGRDVCCRHVPCERNAVSHVTRRTTRNTLGKLHINRHTSHITRNT